MTTVLLAHSRPAIRAWMRDALAQAPGVELVAEVSAGEEAVSLAEQIRWGVILVSHTLPGKPHGIEAVERIREIAPDTPVLVLGIPNDDEALCRLWRAGTAGCIPDDAVPGVVARSVRVAAAGAQLWPPDQVARAQRWWEKVGSKLEALTEREREILLLVARGLSNNQIATYFSLSVNTVRAHLRNTLRKLAANSRWEAATLLVRETSINQSAARNSPRGR